MLSRTTGDAHYIYKSTPEFARFGGLHCHNRKEVEGYLKDIIRASTAAAPQSMEEEVTLDAQGNYHLPRFVTFTWGHGDLNAPPYSLRPPPGLLSCVLLPYSGLLIWQPSLCRML